MSEEDNDHSPPNPGSGSAKHGWQASFARWLGSAARWATTEVDSMTAWTKQVVVGPPPPRQRRAPPADPLGPLLDRLGELVARHAADGPRSLARDPLFWTVIDRLHARRPRVVRARPGPRSAVLVKSPEPVVAPPVVDDEAAVAAVVAEIAGGEEADTTAHAFESPILTPEPTEAAALDQDTESARIAGSGDGKPAEEELREVNVAETPLERLGEDE